MSSITAKARYPTLWGVLFSALPWIILLTGFILTGLYWTDARNQSASKAESDFQNLADRLNATLADRITANEQVLRGIVGLFDSSDYVGRQEFQTFVAALNLDRRYPGIQGVGFSLMISPAELNGHVTALRTEGFSNYTVHPVGVRDVYSAITYLEPFDWRNQRAFGYDMYAEPVRRAAMARALETGNAAMSGKVILLQETQTDVQSGFLLYIPVYRRGLLHDTIEQRRANLLGWAYSPIRMSDMMNGLLEHDLPGLSKLIAITIHDGDKHSAETLMYASQPEQDDTADTLKIDRKLTFSGHQWTLSVRPLPAFLSTADTYRQNIILLTGLVITLLLVALARILTFSHFRVAHALEQVDQANHELYASKIELEKNTKELEKHRNHLEELVAEQTEALTLSNTQLLCAKDAAEAANRAKDAFLANMSHEIRTPLNAISGMTYLVKRDITEPKQVERLQKVDAAVNHLLNIVNDVLDLSRIEAGNFHIEAYPLHLDSVIDEVLAQLKTQAAEKGLQLESAFTAFPGSLLGDAKCLGQALLNLTNNAVKFTEQGSITLRVDNIDESANDVLVKFTVIDSGVGIEPAAVGRLFSPFEQADNSTTRKYGGTGLGLAITRRLAQLMGGEAGVSSTPGVGSTFWFTARLQKTVLQQDQARADDGAA